MKKSLLFCLALIVTAVFATGLLAAEKTTALPALPAKSPAAQLAPMKTEDTQDQARKAGKKKKSKKSGDHKSISTPEAPVPKKK